MRITAALRLSALGLLLTLFSSAAVAQFNPSRIAGGVQQGAEDHAKELEDAMKDPAAIKPELPPTDPNGWQEHKMADGSVVRLYVQHPYYAGRDGAPNLPAIVIAPEWWGVNDETQQRAKDLAAKGYYTVAVDLYDGKTANDAAEAAKLHGGVTADAAQKRLKAGVDFISSLVDRAIIDKTRIASMGGQEALQLAVADPRIKATVIFYGPVLKDAALIKKLQGPVLGIFGNSDTAPSPADVNAFEKALKDAKIESEIDRFDGAGHSFASKSAESAGLYKETQAKDAWEKTYAWLGKTLKPAK